MADLDITLAYPWPVDHEVVKYRVTVPDSRTVLDVKRMVGSRWRIDEQYVLLSIGHKLLDSDAATLADCSVEDGAVIFVTEYASLPDRLDDEVRSIKETEHRGITLRQLRSIIAFMRRYLRLSRETLGWFDTYEKEHVRLKVDTINMYQVNEWIIKPATRPHGCSFVEFMCADAEAQVPAWFISHFWGEEVVDFLACMAEHVKVRQLSGKTAYWVCAYANNQHDLGGEIAADPRETSFYRALMICRGVLVILDKEATPFSRIWCCFESYIALSSLGRSEPLLLDIATKREGSGGAASVIADGPTKLDNSGGPLDGGWGRKMQREAKFPLELVLRKGLQISIEAAQASRAEDKARILNFIAGGDLSSSGWPAGHEAFGVVGDGLGARFAWLAWPQASHRNLADFRRELARAIGKAQESVLCVQPHSFGTEPTDEDVQALTLVMSPKVSEINIDLQKASGLRGAGFVALGAALHSALETLKLNISECPLVEERALSALLDAMPQSLVELQLRAVLCKQLSGSVLAVVAKLFARAPLRSLYINTSGCANISSESIAHLLKSLPHTLQTLDIAVFGCGSNAPPVSLLSAGQVLPAALRRAHIQAGRMMDDACMLALGQSLPSALRSLSLNCGGSDLTTDSGLQVLGLLPGGLEELSLGFQGCQEVSGEHASLGSQCLPPSLRRLALDLTSTRSGDAMLRLIAQALPPSLLSVELLCNHCTRMTDAGFEAFVVALPASCTLLTLSFDHCVQLGRGCFDVLQEKHRVTGADGQFSFKDTHMEVCLQRRLAYSRWWDELEFNEASAKEFLHEAVEDETSTGGIDTRARLRQFFYEWDQDGNGTLSQKEMFAALHTLDPEVFSADNLDTLFEAADADGDGQVSMDELLDWMCE